MISSTQQLSIHTEKALKFTKSWYGHSMPDQVDTGRFLHFVMNSTELFRGIVDAEMRVDYSAPSAYTDGKTVFIPVMYFIPEFYFSLGIEAADHVAAAVTCINGSQIHESIHIVESSCDLEQMASLVSKAHSFFKLYPGFAAILNIVEDLYIEEWCRENQSALGRFIDSKNEILLGDFPSDDAFRRLYSDGVTTDDLVNGFSLLKNTRIAKDPRWAPWQQIVDTFEKARMPHLSKTKRTEIAVEIFEMIMTASKEDGDPMPQGDSTTPSTSQSDDQIDRDGNTEKAMMQAFSQIIKQEIQKANTGQQQPGSEDQGEGSDLDATSIVMMLTGVSGIELVEMEKELNNKIEILVDEFRANRGEGNIDLDRIPEPVLQSIEEVNSRSFDRLSEDRDFRKLGEMLRYLRDEKHTTGRAREEGSVLVKQRIHRIATDGKIMSDRDSKKLSKGKPEVIMLVDISGSMESTRGSKPGETLIKSASRVAMSSFGSFMRAGVPCSVFAHTTTSLFGATSPIIYGVAGFEMPLHGSVPVFTHDYVERFSLLLYADHNANSDGIAIDYCLTRFTSRPGSKVLIVVCDGEPSGGGNYHGRLARQHTRLMAAKARKMGIHVIVVSLVEGVVESNDEIYGPENNLKGFGNQLESTFKQIVHRLSLSR